MDTPWQFVPEVGSLFSFSKDWKPTKHVTKITVSNGLAWSEDLKFMYYIDSPTRKVDAFDFDAENVKLCKYSRTYMRDLSSHNNDYKDIMSRDVMPCN